MTHKSNFKLARLDEIQLKQLITPPFRVETNLPPRNLPVYSTLNPVIPPLEPYRPVNVLPTFPAFSQIEQIITPSNLFFWQR
ncbi:MAG TPA: hypothetical protein DEF42_13080 [Desulfosporosinus sp.]|nr:hypothetical protein [Desulfosporosinus sp.]